MLECEALVKIAYADQGTRDGLLANLAALIDDTTAKLHFGDMIAATYLDGRGPFPDRLPLSGLMWRFLWEYHVTVLRWARWARDQVQAWPEDLSQLDVTAEFSRIVSAASSPRRAGDARYGRPYHRPCPGNLRPHSGRAGSLAGAASSRHTQAGLRMRAVPVGAGDLPRAAPDEKAARLCTEP